MKGENLALVLTAALNNTLLYCLCSKIFTDSEVEDIISVWKSSTKATLAESPAVQEAADCEGVDVENMIAEISQIARTMIKSPRNKKEKS